MTLDDAVRRVFESDLKKVELHIEKGEEGEAFYGLRVIQTDYSKTGILDAGRVAEVKARLDKLVMDKTVACANSAIQSEDFKKALGAIEAVKEYAKDNSLELPAGIVGLEQSAYRLGIDKLTEEAVRHLVVDVVWWDYNSGMDKVRASVSAIKQAGVYAAALGIAPPEELAELHVKAYQMSCDLHAYRVRNILEANKQTLSQEQIDTVNRDISEIIRCSNEGGFTVPEEVEELRNTLNLRVEEQQRPDNYSLVRKVLVLAHLSR